MTTTRLRRRGEFGFYDCGYFHLPKSPGFLLGLAFVCLLIANVL